MKDNNEWEDCYDKGWGKLIVQDAFCHPAKFSRNLIKRIYTHAIDNEWIKKGDIILDPFGGIALGGYDAIGMGLNWIGVELEEKFVKLGEQNIELWNSQLVCYFNDPSRVIGTARIVRGDSRYLLQYFWAEKNADEMIDLVISSPPYADQSIGNKTGTGEDVAKRRYERLKKAGYNADALMTPGRRKHNLGTLEDYGHTPGNLANMKEGDIDCVISSPPFLETQGGGGGIAKTLRGEGDYPLSSQGGKYQGYQNAHRGNTPGNLANMKEGDIDCVIGSPPFVDTLNDYKHGLKELGSNFKGRKAWEEKEDRTYGQSPGQLGSMKEGSIDAVISSPPYADSYGVGLAPTGTCFGNGASSKLQKESGKDAAYGSSPGQLGSLKEGSIDAVISSPPYANENIQKNSRSINRKKQYQTYRSQGGGASFGAFCKTQDLHSGDYGQSLDNLANMKEGDVSAIISSPPYSEMNRPTSDKDIDRLRKGGRKTQGGPQKFYSSPVSPGQLGSSGDTFWSASREIVQGCYDLLKPGGHAIWVTKDYVRDKKRVTFSEKWTALCESVGFKVVCSHCAKLVSIGQPAWVARIITERKSFFRRLQEKKGSPKIDWEDVVCMVK